MDRVRIVVRGFAAASEMIAELQELPGTNDTRLTETG